MRPVALNGLINSSDGYYGYLKLMLVSGDD